MKITIDTATDSKEEIVRVIKLLQDSIKNKGYGSNDYDSYNSNYANSYNDEKPKQQEFSLGALNFNDEPKVEAVDFSEPRNEIDSDEPTEAEIQELIRRQTINSSDNNSSNGINNIRASSQSSQPNAFGAMFGGESKNDLFSNNPQFGEEDPDDDDDDSDKEEEKNDDWGPRTNITLGDLERY